MLTFCSILFLLFCTRVASFNSQLLSLFSSSFLKEASFRNKTSLSAEFRLLIQGTKNAYTTVRSGDILSYRIDQAESERSIRLGVFGSDGNLYPLCNRVKLGSEFYIDNTVEPLSIEKLKNDGKLLRVISSEKRSDSYIIEEYLDDSILIPVIPADQNVVPSSELSNRDDHEHQIEVTLREISGLNKKLTSLLLHKRGGSNKTPTKTIVQSPHAPKPVGPYSQAVKSNGVLYVSGCIGLSPVTGKLVSDDITEQTKQALQNLHAVLKAGNSDWKLINKVTIFTTNITQFSLINSIYSDFLKENEVEEFPARSTVEVSALPLGAKFEIEVIANYVE